MMSDEMSNPRDDDLYEAKTCERCGGSGSVTGPCEKCGHVAVHACSTCSGSGRTWGHRRIAMYVAPLPRGVTEAEARRRTATASASGSAGGQIEEATGDDSAHGPLGADRDLDADQDVCAQADYAGVCVGCAPVFQRVYEDEDDGESGPGLSDLREGIRARKWDRVFIWHLELRWSDAFRAVFTDECREAGCVVRSFSGCGLGSSPVVPPPPPPMPGRSPFRRPAGCPPLGQPEDRREVGGEE